MSLWSSRNSTPYELEETEVCRSAWTKAARAGDSEAMLNLGNLLREADPPDRDGARHWFRKGAEAGDSGAMLNLGALLKS